ncbi:unnamed protein product [Vitrella brassicaformis CCMP3155]|uniref:Uncharacterized protein n=1 Tax=Vitrella brassicaformis (strain CCMP3155) TaxID=1169540 RepID=A0A0G4EVH6_VITBC|nr:unnamed protein product [Vitrella brassicaformis CCMP3155]|eukprot:CEM02636.1 unnamed protein product [Vitrella brassicaformis CCMP3155]
MTDRPLPSDVPSALHSVTVEALLRLDELRRSTEGEQQQYKKRIFELETQRDDYRRERDEALDRARRAEEELRELRAPGHAQNDNSTVGTIAHQGGLYHGPLANGVPDGRGVLVAVLHATDGETKIYGGEWRGGERHGKGAEFATCQIKRKKKTCLVYEGDFADGKRDGKDTEYASDGQKMVNIYEGGWKNGMRRGHGKSTSTPGRHCGRRFGETVYEGQRADGEMKGDGRITNLNLCDDKGDCLGQYTGPTLDGKPHGEGKVRHCGGVVYDGGWKEGKQHGQGEERTMFSEGVSYNGEWVEGDKKGAGVATGMLWECGLYYGETLDGKPHGQGELRDYRNKELVVYSGEWRDGERHGQGKASAPFARSPVWFEGEWRENLIHKGTLFPEGVWFSVTRPGETPTWPIKAIQWQEGQQIADMDVGGKTRLWQVLKDRGTAEYLPAGTLV